MAADRPAAEPPEMLCLRSEAEAADLLRELSTRGLHGIALEVLTYREVWQTSDSALPLVRGLPSSTLLVLTSQRGVAAWSALCGAAGIDATRFEVAAVGAATAAAAGAAGLPVVTVGPSDAVALTRAIAASGRAERRALFAVAREASSEPEALLASEGWEVSRLETYASAPAPGLRERLEHLREVAWAGVIATSPNRVETLLASLDAETSACLRALPWFVVGERTAARARALGVRSITVASGASMPALVDAAASALAPSSPGDST